MSCLYVSNCTMRTDTRAHTLSLLAHEHTHTRTRNGFSGTHASYVSSSSSSTRDV